MNRKQLTATQILHGARAYSHNASRRAHQLSGPKRVRVMRGPVGDAALNDGIDSSCEHCGYQLCNCGPCATCGEVPYYCSGTHAYEPPKPSARALDNLPAEPSPAGGRFKVGDRVRGRGCATGDWHEGTVLSIREDIGLTALLVASGAKPFVSTSSLEPAPSPVSEAPTAESDEAVLMRCGWRAAPELGRSHIHIATDVRVWTYGGCYFWTGCGNQTAPTLLQAACAALGITLEIADPNGSEFFSGCYRAIAPNAGEYEGALVTATGDRIRDIETAARAALEAWSRREEPAS